MDQTTTIFLEYRNLLFSLAYNMIGRVDVAQDLVQDTFLKWLEVNSKPTQHTAIRHPKAFLVKILTNKCINYGNSAHAKREKYIGVWLPEPLQDIAPDTAMGKIETYHALSIGLMVLLERLNPRERAVFLLKEVFSYDYTELADIFEITTDNARQILRRAKEHLGQDSRRFEVDIKAHENILHNFLRAVTEGTVDDLILLLKEDIILLAEGGSQPLEINGQRLSALGRPIQGKKNVANLVSTIVSKLFTHIPGLQWKIILVNGLPSILSLKGTEPFSLVSLDSDGQQISNMYIQTNPQKLRHFKSNN
jgi:RNA polymerase sigma-70 factor (ECF subfamily)